jgi:hypothetical protein
MAICNLSSKRSIHEMQVRVANASVTGLRLVTGTMAPATLNGLRHKAFRLLLTFTRGDETIADVAGAPVWASAGGGNTTLGVTWDARVPEDVRMKIVEWMQVSEDSALKLR